MDADGKTLVQLPGTLGQGIPCPVCNPSSPFNKDAAKNPSIEFKPGYSPSSFHGAWTPEPKKKELVAKYKEILPKLAQIEAQMGIGGSEIVEITKHKIETIGTVMNDWGAVRIDPIGKMSPAFVGITPYFPVTVSRPTPLIEQVQVDDLPGGTYTLNVCNKYNILVGAGGVNLKTYGVVNIAGAMTNIAGEQVNIGSANEVNIDGGKKLNLVGDIVSIKQRNNEQVLLDSSVGITGNLVVKGGIFVEGNLTALSTSTTQIVRNTDQTKVTAKPHTDGIVGVAIPMSVQGNISKTDSSLKPSTPGDPLASPVYMGYTDPGGWVGYCPPGMIIGNVNIGGAIGIVNITSTGFFVQGTGPAESAQTITAKAARLAEASAKYNNTTAAQADFATWTANTTNIIPPKGSTVNTGMTLRGLPAAYVNYLYNPNIDTGLLQLPAAGPGTYTADDASRLAPMLVVGAGAQPDPITCAEHSHTYSEGDAPSHAMHRAEFAVAYQNGLVPTKSENHGPSLDQELPKISKTMTTLFSFLKGG